MPKTLSAIVAIVVLAASADAQAPSFLNYESPLVHAIRLSADGTRLFAAHTADNRLLAWSLADPSNPVLLAEIPVGLEPVSVTPRTNDEVWVANHLSDSVSIVSVSEGRVIDTLRVKDEPSDVVFAGGRAFVSAAASDEVRVFDVSTHALVGTVAVFGKDPRALAVNPAGTRVYALVERSGNKTTLIRASAAPAPPTPTNTALPAPPQVGLIVASTDPSWTSQIPYTLPDNDIVEINVSTLAVTRSFTGVGTTNLDLVVHPSSGDLWVSNINSRNLVRFEPNLRGHAIDSRLTKVTTGATPVVTPIDLNPTISYATLPNAPALGIALAEPNGLALDAVAARLYVAAQGTDRIGVVDLSGNVVARIEIGSTPGSVVNTIAKRGPRALALLASASRLYVLNKLSSTITIVDTAGAAALSEFPLGSFDPTPATIRDGRKFLYDAKLSGNGTMSCASCHIDGDIDGIAWDLGDPGGSMANVPAQPFPFNLGLSNFHPMKGPMTTQTLKGLSNTSPLHWRGDRADFQAFNGAFASLLGGSQLSVSDMNLYAAFGNSMVFPPNPNEPLNRSYLTTPNNTNQAAGSTAFQATVATLPLVGAASCTTCHVLPSATNRMIISGQILQESQGFKVPALRNLYRRTGFVRAAGAQKSGFGFTHDGGIDTLTSFVNQPQFSTWPSNTKDDIVEFLMAFDTGTAPTVGYQVTVTQANAVSATVTSDLALLTSRAAAGDIDLVVKGTLNGAPHGLLYAASLLSFSADQTGLGPYTLSALITLVQAGNAVLTFTGVAPGTGQRIALDRDLDGVLDGDDGAQAYGVATNGCTGAPRIGVNSEPRIGNTGFAVVCSNAAASANGVFALGVAPLSQSFAGITLLVDLVQGPPLVLPVTSDAAGWSAFSIPLPQLPALVGVQVYAQFAFADACGPQGLSASAGLHLTVRP